MYEIWLAANILFEIAMGLWPWLGALLVIWLIAVAAKKPMLGSVRVSRLLMLAAGVAALVGVGLPYATRSGFSNFGYWVDWANLLAIAAGVGVTAAVWVWPWLARRPAS